MLKFQQLLLNLLALAFLGIALALMLQNTDTFVSVHFFSFPIPQQISLGILLGLTGLFTGLAIVCKMGERLLALNTRQQKTSRELERHSVTTEEAEAKTKVLEDRIKTLEQALETALKRINP